MNAMHGFSSLFAANHDTLLFVATGAGSMTTTHLLAFLSLSTNGQNRL